MMTTIREPNLLLTTNKSMTKSVAEADKCITNTQHNKEMCLNNELPDIRLNKQSTKLNEQTISGRSQFNQHSCQ